MDLREVGYDDRDWINLAQNRDRWRAYIMSRSKSGVKRPSIDPAALKKAVETVLAPPGNKISIREACSSL
ncbi:hypothetical protein ANN_09926 [Periplaneta americana]|uniref:Per a allergen n=1 Tax=Periplaneta americana TaxID=6978 RepID=A0ABQ8TQB2_PERAM|nr:hypothetical protein ANN_09926 [Periplaneta americana]